MGFIFANQFVEPNNVTARTTTSPYYADNVLDLWDLNRHFKAGDKNTNDWILKFDFGNAVSLKAVFLNDVNFSEVLIMKSSDDIYYYPASGDCVLMLDERVNRYKIFIHLESFNNRYLKIHIPTTAYILDNEEVWRVGTVVFIEDYIELTENPSFGYNVTVTQKFKDIEKISGSKVRVGYGDLVWSGELPFDARSKSKATELWKVNQMSMNSPVILYENLPIFENSLGYGENPYGEYEFGDASYDTSKCYLCLRDNNLQITYKSANVVVGNTIKFTEIV